MLRSKKINPNIKKNKGKYTLSIVLIAILTFLIFTFGNFLIDSQKKHIKDFYTDFITGDLIIRQNVNTHSGPFMIPDFSPPKGNIVCIDEYSSIETFLLNNVEIASFTPYTLSPVTFINENKGKILIWLKIIDMKSFFTIFPEISFSQMDDSPLDSVQGILLPKILTIQTGDLLNTTLTGGDHLLITDEKAQISSVREIILSGIVSYNGYDSLFPNTGYCTVKSYPWQGVDISLKNETEKEIISLFPGKDTFYKNFITKKSPIQKTELHDSYFFEFFNFNRKSYEEKKPYSPAWQYIAVSVKQKNRVDSVKNSLNNQFYINDQNVIALSWKDTAGPILNTIFTYRIFLYFITLIMLLFLFAIAFLKIKNCVKSLKTDEIESNQEDSISSLRKVLLSLNSETIISSATGILASVLIVLVINAAKLSPASDFMSIILAGGNTLFITISIAPIFISILLSLVFTIIINIYPFTQLSHSRDHQEKHKETIQGNK